MKESILFDEFWSHPNKLLENHIKNMISAGDEELDKQVKLYHDIAKLKNNFQIYIRDTSNDKLDKNHSLLCKLSYEMRILGQRKKSEISA